LEQVSRDKSLKIPKDLDIIVKQMNMLDEELEVRKAIYQVHGKQMNEENAKNSILKRDADLEIVDKIPSNASELMVITVIKKLTAYVVQVTEKSPKKFRGVFVNRMQNYCLDSLELVLKANFIKMNGEQKKVMREDCQQKAIVRLKMLGYVAMLALNVNCILPRQYKQICTQSAYAINLVAAWKKSDDARYKK
jgi:hypothetical protein